MVADPDLGELDDVDGNSVYGFTIWPSSYDAIASINFGYTGPHPYSYQPTTVSEAGGNESAFIIYNLIGNDWLPGSPAIYSDFEIKADTVSLTGSGLTAVGATSTWLDLTTFRAWHLWKDGSSIGFGSWVLDFEIRQKTNYANNATGTYTLNTEVVI